MFKFQILIPLLFSFSAAASLGELTKEYLKSNSMIKSYDYDLDSAKIDLDIERDKRPWTFSSTVSGTDSNLDASVSSVTTPNLSKYLSGGLSKELIWGGEFSFENTLTSVEYEGVVDELNIFSQKFSYSQDLGSNRFGRNDYLTFDVANETYKLSKLVNKQKISEGILAFIETYYSAVLNQTTKVIRKDSYERSRTRTKLVRRRVKDGLRERVDLYQAQSSELSAKEDFHTTNRTISLGLENLAKHLHRAVLEREVKGLNFNSIKTLSVPRGDINSGHLITNLDKKLEIAQMNLEKANNNVFPTVSLSTSLETNDYDTTAGTAISEGIIGSDASAFQVALTVSLPIGFSNKKQAQTKARISKMKAQTYLEASKRSIKIQERLLKARIKSLDQSILSVKRRLDLARKSLKEYTRLYRRGRSDIDQVLTAEGTLNSTQLQLASYIVDREKLVYSLYHLYGKLNAVFLPGVGE